MFKGKVYKAILDAIKQRVDEAERKYEQEVKEHEATFEQKKKDSLDAAVKSVIK